MDTFRSPSGNATCAGRIYDVRAMAARVGALLHTSEVLLQAARPVDLRGLEAEVGRLCAASLDLPPDEGRLIREELSQLLARLDAVGHALRPSPA